MEQAMQINGLYERTVHLYENRHRRLTIKRMHKETGFPIWFLSQFGTREPVKNQERVQEFHDYLLRYANDPTLI